MTGDGAVLKASSKLARSCEQALDACNARSSAIGGEIAVRRARSRESQTIRKPLEQFTYNAGGDFFQSARSHHVGRVICRASSWLLCDDDAGAREKLVPVAGGEPACTIRRGVRRAAVIGKKLRYL